MIEKLTDYDRAWMQSFSESGRVRKALRIIDQLTEALTAASDPMREQTWARRFAALTERAHAAEARVRELTEALAAAEQLASSRLKSFQDAYASVQHLQATVVDKEIAYDMACERVVSAENLARELEAQVEKLDGDFEETATELAALRERVASAIDAITSARLVTGSAETAWAKQALEALRGS